MTEDEKRLAYQKLGILEWTENRDMVREERKKNDPLNVKRYDYQGGDGQWVFPGHVESNVGDWVSYEDHVRVVEHLKKQIDKAYQDGKANGSPEYSWRL